jgi:hypothetical protein
MKAMRVVAAAMIVGGLGFGSVALGPPMALAQPGAPIPLKPGHDGGNDNCPPRCYQDQRRDDWNRHDDRNRWNDNNRHDDRGPWWANNRHDWWDDRNGPPPWGWGPPPPIHWNGGPPPRSLNYWGYNVNPVWDDRARQWGVWLLGVWIPVFGVGFN